MKNSIFFILLLIITLPAVSKAQNTRDTTMATPANGNAGDMAGSTGSVNDMSHPLKTNDEWLPRWAFDFNFRAGKLNQDVRLMDQHNYFSESQNRSQYADPEYTNGTTIGGDISLDYFFSDNRRWGLSIGAMYLKHSGTATIDNFLADYKATFKTGPDAGKFFRQIIRSNAPIIEEQTTTCVNIPVLLKYKWSFAGRGIRPGFGLDIEAGPVFGVQSTTTANARGNFSYEAIYSLDGNKNSAIFGLDTSILNGIGNPGTSQIYTEAYYRNKHDDADLVALFDQARTEGKNVGLNHDIAPDRLAQTSHHNKISLGAMVQAGITYQFSYNVAFLLNGYFIYQNWQNKIDNNYRITEDVVPYNGHYFGSYTALTEGTEHAHYTAYGLSAGIRLFFGERPDLDNDGVRDKDDKCRDIWGIKEFQGCPDSDGDGIPDAVDRCPNKAGLAEFDGCPDTDGDGWPDDYDKCPLVAGTYKGCPPANDTLKTLRTVDDNLLPPHVLLSTDVLYFAFDSSNITDSALLVLVDVKSALEKEPRIVVYISGHTDNVGSDKANLYLSYKRAKAAKNYLIDLGIDPKRIIMGGYGKENPATTNDTPENRALNRRIELMLLLPLKTN